MALAIGSPGTVRQSCLTTPTGRLVASRASSAIPRWRSGRSTSHVRRGDLA